jgi:hypothetical protein
VEPRTHRIYRLTSLGRPVEPKYPTNRAILRLMPLASVTAGAVTLLRGSGLKEGATSALAAFFLVFACWALGRELAPDDDPAAFIGTGLAAIAWWWWPSPGLLLVFGALAVSRLVNRSTGLTARLSDSVIVAALIVWIMIGLHHPLAGLVGAFVFVLDARLADPNPRQWLFAAFCLAALGVQAALTGPVTLSVPWPPSPSHIVAAAVLLAFPLVSSGVRSVSSVGDVGGLPLNSGRVRGGMFVVWLLALQATLEGPDKLEIVMPILAVMAGVVIGGAVRRIKPS